MKTLVRTNQLVRVFSDGGLLSVHIARLSVLYEDLCIESKAIQEDSIPALDSTGKDYRRHYFFRRFIGTFVEFAEALRLLNQCPEFPAISSQFDHEQFEEWERAIAFFNENEELLKRVRNDTGGHFGQKAASHAVKNLNLSATGSIEIRDTTGLHLPFAGEIAAVAILRHVPFKRLIDIAGKSLHHSTRAVLAIVLVYLWPRFG